MRRLYSHPLFVVLALAGLLSSCQQEEKSADPAPTVSASSLDAQLVKKWRLDEVQAGGQMAAGDNVKDRHTMEFRADGTYSQTLLKDGTVFNGTWKLEQKGTLLRTIDHKKAPHEYTITLLNNQELRYSKVINPGETVELRYTSMQ